MKLVINIIVWSCLLFPPTSQAQDNLTFVTTLTGESEGDRFSFVSDFGDVNNDGFDDFMVGTQDGKHTKLYFGGSPFNPDNYYQFQYMREDGFYETIYNSFAGRGDLNGDGIDDFVIASRYYLWLEKIMVFFGNEEIDSVASLTILEPGNQQFGSSLSICGDLNNDGYNDLLVGAISTCLESNNGAIIVYFGGEEMDGEVDIYIEGTDSDGDENFDCFGFSVSIIGDVNNDNYDDFLVGNTEMTDNADHGSAHLFFGGDSIGFDHSVKFNRDTLGYFYGKKVEGLGDLNNDGHIDFGIISHDIVDIFSGQTLELLTDINSEDENWNIQTLSGGTDINNDGCSDFIIGYNGQENMYCGGAAIYLGASDFNATPLLEISGTTEHSYFASEIIFGIDINSDDIPEIIINEPGVGDIHIYSYGDLSSVDNSDGQLANKYKLCNNYPNPFNPTTQIEFSLSETSQVKLEVFNILGECVAELLNKELTAGSHTINFNAENLPSGIYIYSLTASNFKESRKMVLLK